MERYLVVIICKEVEQICYDILTEKEYKTLLDKKSQKEKEDYILELEEEKKITYYQLGLLFEAINLKEIKIVDTYIFYWE